MNSEDSDLDIVRKKIDAIDAKILALLDERTRHAREVKEGKKKLGIGLIDKSREEFLYGRLKVLNKDTIIPDEYIHKIWEQIINLNKSQQEGR